MDNIKYGHTKMGTYSSIFRFMPGLGSVFSWILDFGGVGLSLQQTSSSLFKGKAN